MSSYSESIPNGFAKSQNKLKYSSQAQKMAPNGWASREAKWVFATVASHLCLTLFICHFIFLLFCLLFCSSLFLFSFFCVAHDAYQPRCRSRCPCRKPKSNDNGKYKRVIEMKRGREWRLGFFKWFGYVSLRS